jgi:hypothetical protein
MANTRSEKDDLEELLEVIKRRNQEYRSRASFPFGLLEQVIGGALTLLERSVTYLVDQALNKLRKP